jgi:hypothetical protein
MADANNNPEPAAQTAALTAAQVVSTSDIVALTAAVSGLAGVVAASRDATPTQGHT